MTSLIEQQQPLPGLSLPRTETFDDWRNLGRSKRRKAATKTGGE